MEYIRRDNRNYVVFSYDEEDVDKIAYNMLKNRRLKNIIPMSCRYLDNRILTEFDITGLQPIGRIYDRRKLTKEEIIKYMKSLLNALEELEEYLLEVDNLYTDSGLIYTTPESDRLVFCCDIGKEHTENVLGQFVDFIMNKADYSQTDAVGLAYSIVKAADSDDPVRLIKELISGGADEKQADTVSYELNRETYDNGLEESFLQSFSIKKKKKRFLFGGKKKKPLLAITETNTFQNTDSLGESSGVYVTKPLTMQLTNRKYYLKALNDERERIEIDHFPFVFGKLKDGTDYIPDSMMVSRLHARFDKNESDITIEDMNSSNGTYINGVSIFGKGAVVLHDGDKIALADMKYIFEIYG